MKPVRTGALIGAFGLAVLAGAAQAADIVVAPTAPHHSHYGHTTGAYHTGTHHGHHDALPLCDEPNVMAKIADNFAYGDARIMHTGLVITHIDGIHQHGLRAGGPSLIDRRYCGGTAWMSDGRRSEVVYLIESRQGFASAGWNVESCLPAFDPHHVYGAYCRSVRP